MNFRHFVILGSLPLAATCLLIAGCGHHSSSSPSTSFTFSSTPSSDYAQIDRVGMPGVNTAVITSKDAYNAATPADDGTFAAPGLFGGQITTDVTNLDAKLATALTNAGFVPASASTSLAQAGPHIIPDVLSIDTTQAAGFPNGRMLADPVMDITLSLILLDWSQNGQGPTSFSKIPLNPAAPDKPLMAGFPYLAAPH
jgi:hypothetical protein